MPEKDPEKLLNEYLLPQVLETLSETERIILVQIYSLVGKQPRDLTGQENEIIYYAYQCGGIVQLETERVVVMIFEKYIESKGAELLIKRGNVGPINTVINLSNGGVIPEEWALDEMKQAGISAVLQYLNTYEYDEEHNYASVETHLTFRIKNALIKQINEIHNTFKTTDATHTMDIWLSKAEQKCHARGNMNPTPVDIYNIAKEEGKDIAKKYSLSAIIEALNRRNPIVISYESLVMPDSDGENSKGKEVESFDIPLEDIVESKIRTEYVASVIEQMDPLSRMAIESMLKVLNEDGDLEILDDDKEKTKQATTIEMFRDFKKKYQYAISQDQFERLLYYAKEEFRKRCTKYNDSQKKRNNFAYLSLECEYEDDFINSLFTTDDSWDDELDRDAERFLKYRK